MQQESQSHSHARSPEAGQKAAVALFAVKAERPHSPHVLEKSLASRVQQSVSFVTSSKKLYPGSLRQAVCVWDLLAGAGMETGACSHTLPILLRSLQLFLQVIVAKVSLSDKEQARAPPASSQHVPFPE